MVTHPSDRRRAALPRRLRPAGFVMTLAFALSLASPLSGCAHRPDAPADPDQSRGLSVGAGVSAVRVLDQNWTAADARRFYNAPQGSRLVPYVWFLHLEQSGTTAAFRAADHVRALGYLPRRPDRLGNPDGLPVGFVRDGDHLGLTRAACHTNEIDYRGTAWLVDGAPTLGDAGRLQRELVDALDATLRDDGKFGRFAGRVLGHGAADPAARAGLRRELESALVVRRGYNDRNLPRAGAPAFGPGRVDAFGAILNEVGTTFAGVPGNHAPADAPVSYPFLWDTPHHDRVQWNGAAENKRSILLKPFAGTVHVGALGRNVGEVLGVFGTVDASREGSPLEWRGYPSSADRPGQIAIEDSLRRLWSPRLPPEIATIDEPRRARGEALFRRHCASCHEPIDRDDPDRTVRAVMAAVDTDPAMARNFATRTARSGVLEGRTASPLGLRKLRAEEPARDLLTHLVQRVVLFPAGSRSSSAAAAVPRGTAPAAAEGAPERLLAGAEAIPAYSVVAEVRLRGGGGGERRVTGTFDAIEFAAGGGTVTSVASREPLRLRAAGKLFQQDRGTGGPEARYVAPDGSTADLAAADQGGIREEASAGGTRLTFGRPAPIVYAYKARPLNGIWATAPYLHNGSVPNLDELLKPPAKRAKTFRVGSREFDPVRVGFRTDVGDFTFDTALPGNSNGGHDYDREFTDDERGQLVEYMKSL